MAAGEQQAPKSPDTPELISEAETEEAVLEADGNEDEIAAAAEAASSAVVKVSARKPGPELAEKRKTHNRTSKKWGDREKQILMLGQRALGGEANRWVLISKHLLPGRSATAISNLYRTERYQREIQNQADWTQNIPDELQPLVDRAVSEFRSRGKTEAKTTELQHLPPPPAALPTKDPDVSAADGQVNDDIAATCTLPATRYCPGPTITAPSSIAVPIPRKRKDSSASANRVTFATSAFAQKPPGSTLDSLLLSVPNLYPNLTISEVNATTSVPTNCIVTKPMFERYDAQLKGAPVPPTTPRPKLPDPYHPLAYLRPPPRLLERRRASLGAALVAGTGGGRGGHRIPLRDSTIQTEFDLCNPLDSLPFDHELEDAFWSGGG